jgi:hypothetical protein
MISVPLYFFLFVYLLFVAVFVVFMLINLYHIIASASLTLPSFVMSFFIFAMTALVFYLTFQFLGAENVVWRDPVTLFNVDWFTGLFGSPQF